jgi:hypothetical protein
VLSLSLSCGRGRVEGEKWLIGFEKRGFYEVATFSN